MANKRYTDEDYECYVPTRNNKGNKSESTADESEVPEGQELKRKRGRPPGSYSWHLVFSISINLQYQK